MDRRKALKKLGAGAATAATASVVISSPAFAFTAPTVTGAPTTFTLTKSSERTALIAASGFPAGSCPQSSTNTNDIPSQGTPSYSWTARGTTGTGSTVSVVGSPWGNGETVTVVVTVAYTCQYTPPNSTTRSYSWSRTFTSTGNGNSSPTFAAGAISGPTPV